MLDKIPEDKLRHEDVDMLYIPAAEFVTDMHGKSLYPTYKLVDYLAPTSVTAAMTEENYSKHSGDRMTKGRDCVAFVKPSEVLDKVKPRLIHRFGIGGTARRAPCSRSTLRPFIQHQRASSVGYGEANATCLIRF